MWSSAVHEVVATWGGGLLFSFSFGCSFDPPGTFFPTSLFLSTSTSFSRASTYEGINGPHAWHKLVKCVRHQNHLRVLLTISVLSSDISLAN